MLCLNAIRLRRHRAISGLRLASKTFYPDLEAHKFLRNRKNFTTEARAESKPGHSPSTPGLAPRILTPPEALRESLDKLAPLLNVSKPEDWYKVRLGQLSKAGLSNTEGMLQYEIFQYAYPHHEWIPWLFPKVPKEFWKDPGNQLKFVEWLRTQLKYDRMEDWYKVKWQDFKRHGATCLVDVFQGSFANLLRSVYSDHPWKPWKFDIVPRGYWASLQSRRDFVEDFAQENGISNLEQWYSFPSDRIKKTKFASMLTVTKTDLPTAIMGLYPDHPWQPWRFTRLPGSWWQKKQHRRQYFDFLIKKLGLESATQLLQVPVETVRQNDGGSLMYTVYRNSMARTVVDLYPEIDWTQHGLTKADGIAPPPRNLKNKIPERRKQVLEAVGARLGVKNDLSAWYSITKDKFAANGGASVLKYYRNSLQLALSQIYPEHDWQSSRFIKASKIT